MRQLLLLIFYLLSPVIWAQSDIIERMTDETVSGRLNNEMVDQREFNGRLYGITRSPFGTTPSVQITDLEDGNHRLLPFDERAYHPAVTYRGTATFTEAGGHLFLRMGSGLRDYRLYEVTETEVRALTPDNVSVISNPIALGPYTYFMTLGTPQLDTRYALELWRTDLTKVGTVKVADLAVSTTLSATQGSEAYTITAGTESLVMTAIDDNAFQSTRPGRLITYHPARGVQYVGYSGGSYDNNLPVYEVDYHYDQRSTDQRGDLPVTFYDGYFYFFGKDMRYGNDARHMLYRLREGEFAPQVVIDDWSWIAPGYVPVLADLVANDAYFAVQLIDWGDNVIVLDLSEHPTEQAPILAGSVNRKSTVSSPLLLDELLYVTAGTGNGIALQRVNMATGQSTELTTLPDNGHGYFRVAGNNVYLVPVYGRFPIYRFTSTTPGAVPALDMYVYTATGLRDGGLVFEAYYTEGERGTWQVYTLAPSATEARVVLPVDGEVSRGVSTIEGSSSDGDVVFYQYEADGRVALHSLNRATGGLSEVDRNDLIGDYNYTITAGETVYVVGYTPDRRYFHAIIGGTITPIIHEDTRQLLEFPMDTRWLSGNGTGILFYTLEGSERGLRHVRMDGSTYTETEGLPELTDEVLYLSSTVARNGYIGLGFYVRDEGFRYIFVDESTGETVQDITLPYAYHSLLAMNDAGFWISRRDVSGSGLFGVSYFDWNTATETFVPFPDAPLPPSAGSVFAIGKRLILGRDAVSNGNDYYVADATNGTLEALPEVYAGPGNGVVNRGVRLGDVVYFSGYAGNNATPTLWRTDGTAAGTYAVAADVDPTMGFYSGTYHAITDSAFFFAAEGSAGLEVYSLSLDGNETVRLHADINPGAGDGRPAGFLVADDGLYVVAHAADDAADQVYRIRGRVVSTQRPEHLANLSVFPNPARDRVAVQAPESHRLRDLELYDQLGHRLLQWSAGDVSTAELDLSRLPAGHYTLVSRLTDGRSGRNRITVVR